MQVKPQKVSRESSIHHQSLKCEIQTKGFPKGSDFFSGYKNSPCFYFSQEKEQNRDG